MLRAVKIRLVHATAAKRRQINALLEAYQGAVNFFIRSLWQEKGRLDSDTLRRLPHTRLTAAYKQKALQQALNIVVSTRKAAKALGKPCCLPTFRGGAVLDARFVTLQPAQRTTFDYWLKLSTLKRGQRIWLPLTSTAVLNKWMNHEGAELVQGCGLGLDEDGVPFVILWVRLPDAPVKEEGETVGLDVGINKLVTLSDGTTLGTECKAILEKIDRRQAGSKGRQRALKERDNFIGRVLNQLPFSRWKVVVAEDLKHIKLGKKENRSKQFRRKTAAWTVAQFMSRLGDKCEENRVLLVWVPAAYTSQTCPICAHVAVANRQNEEFRCVRCGHADDADMVGARNIRARWLGSVESPKASPSVA